MEHTPSLEVRIVMAQLLKVSFFFLFETDGLSSLRQPSTGHRAEPGEFSPRPPSKFSKIHFNITLPIIVILIHFTL